jgi:hypothetical protein
MATSSKEIIIRTTSHLLSLATFDLEEHTLNPSVEVRFWFVGKTWRWSAQIAATPRSPRILVSLSQPGANFRKAVLN